MQLQETTTNNNIEQPYIYTQIYNHDIILNDLRKLIIYYNNSELREVIGRKLYCLISPVYSNSRKIIGILFENHNKNKLEYEHNYNYNKENNISLQSELLDLINSDIHKFYNKINKIIKIIDFYNTIILNRIIFRYQNHTMYIQPIDYY